VGQGVTANFLAIAPVQLFEERDPRSEVGDGLDRSRVVANEPFMGLQRIAARVIEGGPDCGVLLEPRKERTDGDEQAVGRRMRKQEALLSCDQLTRILNGHAAPMLTLIAPGSSIPARASRAQPRPGGSGAP
jgi:hypothetical protein